MNNFKKIKEELRDEISRIECVEAIDYIEFNGNMCIVIKGNSLNDYAKSKHIIPVFKLGDLQIKDAIKIEKDIVDMIKTCVEESCFTLDLIKVCYGENKKCVYYSI